jgi:uncharacterized phage protein (TIGR01671 family)
MRTLKFRAWDKLAKQFTYPDKGYQGHYVLTLNGQFQNLQNGSGGDEYVVQQWTGLKDSKGIDVYEGDAINFLHEKKYVKSEVVYASKFGMFVVVLEPNEKNEILTYKSLFDVGEFEVVGNIFENSELLK